MPSKRREHKALFGVPLPWCSRLDPLSPPPSGLQEKALPEESPTYPQPQGSLFTLRREQPPPFPIPGQSPSKYHIYVTSHENETIPRTRSTEQRKERSPPAPLPLLLLPSPLWLPSLEALFLFPPLPPPPQSPPLPSDTAFYKISTIFFH